MVEESKKVILSKRILYAKLQNEKDKVITAEMENIQFVMRKDKVGFSGLTTNTKYYIMSICKETHFTDYIQKPSKI